MKWRRVRIELPPGPVLCPFSTPCQIITPLVEIALWLPNPNPTPNPNPSPTPDPKPTNTRGVIIWQGSELGTTPDLDRSPDFEKHCPSINTIPLLSHTSQIWWTVIAKLYTQIPTFLSAYTMWPFRKN